MLDEHAFEARGDEPPCAVPVAWDHARGPLDASTVLVFYGPYLCPRSRCLWAVVQDAAKHCTCLGSCCASSANAAVPATGVSVETVAAYALERRMPALRARAVTAPPFFLPYANGPPRPAGIA